MGVTIMTQDDGESISMPCSSLNEFKDVLRNRYIKWIRYRFDENLPRVDGNEETTKEGYAYEFLKLLESYDPSHTTGELTKLCHTLAYHIHGAPGLLKFLDHSDCEGYHSVGDIMDIITTWEIISDGDFGRFTSKFEKLSELWRHALKNNQYVIYG